MAARWGKGKHISELFFSYVEDHPNLYVCKCGTRRKKAGTSLLHIQVNLFFYQTMIALQKLRLTIISSHLNWKPFLGGFIWLWMAKCNFQKIKKPIIRKHVKHKTMWLTTCTRYVKQLVEVVENKISNLLPEVFALVFDCWTSGSTQYLSVFASYSSSNDKCYDLRLVTMSPMGDKCALDANEHYKFLKYILKLYHKSWSNIWCLIVDIVSTNKCISEK